MNRGSMPSINPIKPGSTLKGVSRAKNKLAGATQAFSYDFRGKVVLDIGSSTGGFTELALSCGAKKVVAIEKGTRQMKAPLRFDQRIVLREKTDILTVVLSSTGKKEQRSTYPSSLSPKKRKEQASIISAPIREKEQISASIFKNRQSVILTGLKFDTVLADVSFISLKPILRHVKKHLANPATDYLVMLKPQFEAKAFQLKNGIIKNEKIRREIIKDFEQWLKAHGFLIINKRDNILAGKNGNLERFYYLKNTNLA